ncbi:spermidine synthase [Flavobacterium cellulosilyticum]|uniref:Methyltransferase domain-containing protein n=1 Tax=Flavobacterium cellulosilyticum TaxID=2541731 RepID=A0A4R5CA08_9FLAO|nr:fused MFS/spermidine synthase [Flavobacterium cellulosilyticum]TDD93914.1 methyltransferase domain-containing protein [Flavobacterium cellulosilyticum]
MLKKFLSYLIPINIYKQNSTISKSLEITWTNGKLVLDSENTNYSYGNLQRILRKGLQTIGFERINKMNKILVLGVAGGSVIKTLVEEIKFEGKIIGVEIDKKVIDIADKYFQLNEITNTEIIIDDAFNFVMKTSDKFDLIIIDVFQDLKMPSFLFETYFTDRICALLEPNGFILFNTMVLNNNQKQINQDYIKCFDSYQFKVQNLHGIDATNELLLIESI